jgi:hypothetical protein
MPWTGSPPPTGATFLKQQLMKKPDQARQIASAMPSIRANDLRQKSFALNSTKPDDCLIAVLPCSASEPTVLTLTSRSGWVTGASPTHNSRTPLNEAGVYQIYREGKIRRLTPQLNGKLEFYPPGTFGTRGGVVRPDFSRKALAKLDNSKSTNLLLLD